ncbi:YihY family inner membrane protein [Hydrogenophaga sp.]|uniref:YihY family inner membrane protein n=1 Tax=Hydrogenophaga sp. TaxID=1904254 RepID=UPI0019A85AD5|nr:YihY family inner membrane protein [Hydrogenophaga sp.]MBD3894078.1 YihY family inner membrane protein [Hydrogenophaga sp.]
MVTRRRLFFRNAQALLLRLCRSGLRFPWRNTALTLSERFREDRLGVTASSLSFTTLISLVPLFTVALAMFSAFPVFDRLQITLQDWLIDRMVPQAIAGPVLAYLNEFSERASQMGWVGGVAFLVTALVLILTIDSKLNDMWRVRRSRGLTQRVLVYGALLTLGPLVLAFSLTITSYLVGASAGLVGALPGSTQWLLAGLQFALGLLALTALYRCVPNTRVRWPHALAGGLFAALGFELGKLLLAVYLALMPGYSLIYGTLATLPILLLWIYLAWVIVLLGAVVAAYLPSLLSGVVRRSGAPGWNFQLALELLDQLHNARAAALPGQRLDALALALRLDARQLEEPLAALVALDWLGRLDADGQRYVLRVDPAQTRLAPLIERLLLPQQFSTRRFWAETGCAQLTLEQALTQTTLRCSGLSPARRCS